MVNRGLCILFLTDLPAFSVDLFCIFLVISFKIICSCKVQHYGNSWSRIFFFKVLILVFYIFYLTYEKYKHVFLQPLFFHLTNGTIISVDIFGVFLFYRLMLEM